jgi:hypothetical protein
MKKLILGIVSALSLMTLSVFAAENLPATLMTERGKLIFTDDLGKLVPGVWNSAKGKWEAANGGIKGSELKADKHGAVTRHKQVYKDAVIQVDVQINGCRMASLSINDAKGHVARALINKDGFSAQKDAHDKDGVDKVAVFGKVPLPMPPGEWKTLVIELKGEEMVATMDGKSIAGSAPLIAKDKADVGLTVGGESACFRNLRIWEAQPNPKWPENKKRIKP